MRHLLQNYFQLAILLMGCQYAGAQSNTISITQPAVTPLSPEAAAVVRYVNYPMNHSTGLPQISIPLYEVKSGNLTLPITLTYHSAGFKPNEASGWVGTGWTLNVEPSIVRTVNGLPDDYYNGGYYNNPYVGKRNDWEYMKGIVEDKLFDEDPDQFYYKLLTQSGSFYYQRMDVNTQPYNFIPHPYDLVKIHGDYSYFTMHDENGYIYSFGNYEYCAPSQSIRPYITRWMCDYIQDSQSRSKISFSYCSEINEAAPMPANDYCVVEDSIVGDRIGSLPILTAADGIVYRIRQDGTLSEPIGFNASYNNSSSNNTIHRKTVQLINFDGGTVEFKNDDVVTAYHFVDEGEQKEAKLIWTTNLKYFIVRDNSGKEIRRVDFFISPYNFKSSMDWTKLDSVRISAPGCEDRVYRFAYLYPERVPESTAYRKIDYFGFYNGQRNDTIIPYTQIWSQYYNGRKMENFQHKIGGPEENRKPNCDFSQVGLLNKIVSPEGVTTDYTYEPNLYGWMSGSSPDNYELHSKHAGGSRIYSIKETDPRNNQTCIKHYNYGSQYGVEEMGYDVNNIIVPELGVPVREISGLDFCYEQKKTFINKIGAQTYSRIRVFHANPIAKVCHNNGSPISYNYVREEMEVGGSTFVTTYHYKMYTPAYIAVNSWQCRKDLRFPFEPDPQSDFLYGYLKKQEKYKDGNIVERTEYKYQELAPPEYSIWMFRPFAYNVIVAEDPHANVNNWYVQSAWQLQNGCLRKAKETKTQYDDNGVSTCIIKDYRYDRKYDNDYSVNTMIHTLPRNITTTTNVGQKMEEHFLYPEDIKNGIDLGQESLMSQNMYKELLEYRKILNGDTTITRQKYKEEVAVRKSGNTEFEKQFTIYKHNSYGRIASLANKGQTPTCYIWGYNNQYAIAKIENCTYEALLAVLGMTPEAVGNYEKQDIPEPSFISACSGLRTKLPNSLVTTYTYKPLVGMTSMTTPDGITTYYTLDNYGRLLETYYYENNKKIVVGKNSYNTPSTKNLLP